MSQITTDATGTVDELGREKFAKQIVHSLITSFQAINESIVIGICGPWGSGKSTLLNLIQRELEIACKDSKQESHIILFNSWANTGLEDLERNLIETIISAFNAFKWKKPIKEANEQFKKYLKYLNYLKFVKHVHPVAKNIIEAVDDYIDKASVNSISEIKKQAEKLIEQNDIKVYIIIDDLDRLSPVEIATLFKVLKLNVDFINTFFLIAFDKEVVINSLEQQYGKNGEKYLEKIIQADFYIPQILQEQLEEIFFSRLKQITAKCKVDYEEQKVFSIWRYYGLNEYFQNLRDIKRFFNNLTLTLPTITDEVNFYDFITLESIKTFDHKGYEKIAYSLMTIQRQAVWESASFSNETIKTFQNPTTQSLLDYLFINDAVVHGKTSLNAKRLKNSEYYQRYFSLTIPAKDITEEVLKQFFVPGASKSQIFWEVINNGKITNFLRRLQDSELSKYYVVNDLNIFYSFLAFWDSNGSLITSTLDEYLWHSYFNLAHSFKDSFTGAKEAVKQLILQPSTRQPMRFVFNHFIATFKEDNRIDHQFYNQVYEQLQLMSEDLQVNFLEYLKKNSLAYLQEASTENPTWVTNLFLFSFAKYQKEQYLSELDKLITNDNFLTFVLKSNFLIGSNNEEVGRIDLRHVDIFFPESKLKDFIDALIKIKKGAISERDQNIVNNFLKMMNKN